MASLRSSDPTFWFCWLTTSTVMSVSRNRYSLSQIANALFLALLLRRLHLRDLDLLRRHGFANQHDGVRAAGHGALDHQQVVLRVDAQHLQIAHGHAVGTHVAAH